MSLRPHLMERPELALLEEHGGVRLGQLTAKSVELLDAVAIAGHQVAEGPAGSEANLTQAAKTIALRQRGQSLGQMAKSYHP